MGAGKTTLGKELAAHFKFKFIDIDSEIETLTGKSITQLFEQDGEAFFRLKEQEVLHSLNKKINSIVATGGGAPLYMDNMHWMNKNGLTVYLKLHRGILFHRLLPEKMLRPLVSQMDDVALMQFIMEKLPERQLFYNQSKIILNADKKSTKELILEIKKNQLFNEERI